MGRSSGYRPTKEQEADVLALRAELAKLNGSDWQKASRIMMQITHRIGKRTGPMGGAIQPRTCKFCGYYGHTKQHCLRREAAEERQAQIESRKDAREHQARQLEKELFERRQAERLAKGMKPQEKLFEEMGVEWDWHPAGIGAFPKWYLEERARALPKCTEQMMASDSCR